jgi:hypothetical protein
VKSHAEELVARLNIEMDAVINDGGDVLNWADKRLTETGYDEAACVSFYETEGVQLALPAYPCTIYLKADWMAEGESQ